MNVYTFEATNIEKFANSPEVLISKCIDLYDRQQPGATDNPKEGEMLYVFCGNTKCYFGLLPVDLTFGAWRACVEVGTVSSLSVETHIKSVKRAQNDIKTKPGLIVGFMRDPGPLGGEAVYMQVDVWR